MDKEPSATWDTFIFCISWHSKSIFLSIMVQPQLTFLLNASATTFTLPRWY
jgi:hypothetical protein